MEFTVLMAVYHKEQPSYLRDSLASLTRSTVQPTAVLLVKDGPLTVELEQVIAAFQTQLPLQTVQTPQQQGLAQALNFGLNYCQTPWIARFDSDDRILPQRFERQVAYLVAHPDTLLLGSQIQEFTGTQFLKSRQVPQTDTAIRQFALYRNPFNHMTVMYKLETVQALGGYRELAGFEDYDLWLRILQLEGQVANLPESLVEARAGNEMLSRRGGWYYAQQIYTAYRQFIADGLIPRKVALSRMSLQMFFALLPKGVRAIIYQRWLRE